MRIAISGRSGCGNSTTSRLLADVLKLQLIHYTFHDYAQERKLSFSKVHKMARRRPEIDTYIDQRQIELAKKDNCIVASRLAIWLIEDVDLSIYLSAPLAMRSRRISQREKRNYIATFYITLMRDWHDYRRYRQKYGIDCRQYHFANLIVNTGLYSTKQIVEDVVQKVGGLSKTQK